MTELPHTPRMRLASLAIVAALLAGCASLNFDQLVDQTNREASQFTSGHLTFAQAAAQQEESARVVAELLARPIASEDAVRLALANSPAVQAMLASSWESAATSALSDRIANPLFTFTRMRLGPELEIERALTFSLLDLLTLPQRSELAQHRIEQGRLRMMSEVVDHVTHVRQAWIRAVAAQQSLAAAHRLEATIRAAGSNLREAYSAYRTAYDIARHHRDEVIPLQKLIAEENILRYNGMIIGVFELLADSREQVRSVMAAIAAEEQFWLADAALKASIMGKPATAAERTPS